MADQEEPGSLIELIAKLFGGRPIVMMQLGEDPDTSGLADALREQRTEDLDSSGLSVEQQIACSRGRFPLLVVTMDRVVARDVAGQDLVEILGAGSPEFTYRYAVMFLDRKTLFSIYQGLHQSQLERARRGPDPRCVHDDGSSEHGTFYWPLRRGDRIVQAYFGRVPIPGPAADA